MEPTDTAVRPAGRPRPWLVIALGVTLAVYAATWFAQPGKSAAPAPAPSKPRVAATTGRQAVVPGAVPDVNLGALKQPRPDAVGGRRNPFRFYVPPPPPPPEEKPIPRPLPVAPGPVTPPEPVGPAPPPPIPLKFIGVIEGVPGVGKVAAFSDCRSTMRGGEGDIIDGRYRLVRIGIESVVMEYVDGRGRTTIRMGGECK
jgi:hypothetical protein